jgi:hypothetical protein
MDNVDSVLNFWLLVVIGLWLLTITHSEIQVAMLFRVLQVWLLCYSLIAKPIAALLSSLFSANNGMIPQSYKVYPTMIQPISIATCCDIKNLNSYAIGSVMG